MSRSPKGLCAYCLRIGRTKDEALIRWNHGAARRLSDGYVEDRKEGGAHHVIDAVYRPEIFHNRHRNDCFSHRYDHLRGEQPELFPP